MPQSPRPPEPAELSIFVDRSLGRYDIPNALRAAGIDVHTMVSVYGESAEQRIEDVEWLKHCGIQGWVVLTKDARIRRRARELQIVTTYGLRMFVLTKAGLSADQQLARIIPNLPRMATRARRNGPWIDGLYEGRVRRLWPDKVRGSALSQADEVGPQYGTIL